MLRLEYSASSVADLDAIYDFIASENPSSAWNFVEEIRERCRTLCTYPEFGPARGDLGHNIRIYAMRSKVVVAYRAQADVISIVRVFYGGQDYDALLPGGE